MSNRAWMPLHVERYLADTGHLSTIEHGAYFLLIMHYWREGCLPDDERMVARITRLSRDDWEYCRDVLASFFYDGWKHRRIDDELAKADEIIAKRKAAADAMHAKRSRNASAVQVQESVTNAKHEASTPDASAMQVQSKCSASPPANMQMQSTCSDTRVPPLTNTYQKEEPNGSSKKRGTRIPDDFQPDIGEAIDAGLSRQEADREIPKFLDYWTAQAGQKGVKLDWKATWRNWCRRAAERRQRPQEGSARRVSAVEAYHNQNQNQETRYEQGSRTIDHSDAECVPSNQPRLRGLIGDAVKATGWPE